MDHNHARFSDKVNQNGGLLPWMETNCWEWTGATDKTGRGKFWIGDNRDNSVTAQRAALILMGRTLQPGECVAAVCGNRSCVKSIKPQTCWFSPLGTRASDYPP